MTFLKTVFLSSLYLIAIGSAPQMDITVANLSQKWDLKGYEVFFYEAVPETHEQHDYLHLSEDMTYESISDGVYEQGVWILANKTIQLTKAGETHTTTFKVEALSRDGLTLTLDAPEDEEAQYIKILFKSE